VRKIFEDIYWRGKRLVVTEHFHEEWEALQRPLATLPELLERGEHRLIGPRQRKYECQTPWRGRLLSIVYAENEDVFMIHIKPKRP
jgi:hypothetical protein